MVTNVFLLFVAVATLIAISNWRAGVVLWMIIAILQDPVRKVTVGTPVYLTVSFLPVYVATFFGLISRQNVLPTFAREFPSLHRSFQIIIVMLVASAGFGYTMTHHSLMAALMGVASYVGGLPAVYCGYAFLKRDYRYLDLLVLGFTLVTAAMLVGVPLEHSGFAFSQPWLGTIATVGKSYRWFNNYDYVAMISGFHRSPEIMGWHAMAMVIGCFYLYLKRPSYALIWCFFATWGCYGVFLSGRRKMLLMLFVFAAMFLVFSTLRNRRRIIRALVLTSLILVPAIVLSVNDLYRMSLQSGVDTAGAKATEKMLTGPIWLAGVVGPFGYGVGTLTQGSQHFVQLQDIPIMEGGMEKVMVEVGIVGLFLVVLVSYQLLLVGRHSLKIGQKNTSGEVAPAFCFAYIAANIAAFLVAFQFLGDPFIGTFLGLFVGMLLSTGRIARIQSAGQHSNVSAIAPGGLSRLKIGVVSHSRGGGNDGTRKPMSDRALGSS